MKTLARFLIPLLALVGAFCVWAEETPLGEVAFRQALLDMGTDLRLMCVAAHPDDEDGATLAYARMRYGVKTYTVVATRGEGGQNEIGPELYDELAAIRTREMVAASEVTGAELRFLDLPEFGYSKSPEETFELWGRDETVRRLVRVIREVRPDVIITNHDTLTGHGHHRAIAMALLEAFDAAGDPDLFPEQIQQGLEPWDPKRLLMRSEQEKGQYFYIDVNSLDTWRGLTYSEVAADALRRHRSQGMQSSIERLRSGKVQPMYRLTRWNIDNAARDGLPAPGAGVGKLFRNLLDRVGDEDRALSTGTGLGLLGESDWEPTGPVDPALNEAVLMGLGLAGRAALAPRLLAYAARLSAVRDASPLDERQWARANLAAVRAAELQLKSELDDPLVVEGQTVTLSTALRDFGVSEATSVVLSVRASPWFVAETPEPVTLEVEGGEPVEAELPVRIGTGVETTVPEADHVFEPHFLEPQLTVAATVYCAPAVLEIELPVRLDVAPRLEARFGEARYLARVNPETPVELELRISARAPGGVEDAVDLDAPTGLELEETRFPVEIAEEDAQRVYAVRGRWSEDAAPGDYEVTARNADGSARTSTQVRRVDVKVPQGILVGVVQSYDDTLVKTLAQLGVPHEALSIEDFVSGRLDRFSTILVDIRAYFVRPDLVANNRALLDYVERGGTAIVMYQKTMEWKSEYAPYPLHVSTNRVTREDAPVELLEPEHPLFREPNAISEADWEGWIQERGLYFADDWDERYVPLIRTVDPGEDIPPGSLLVTHYGEGTYVYTALVWYRQLRALHPGALRLFANLLGL